MDESCRDGECVPVFPHFGHAPRTVGTDGEQWQGGGGGEGVGLAGTFPLAG